MGLHRQRAAAKLRAPMVKIRLSRVGRRNTPLYRIIVVDGRRRRDGRYLERLGHYNPHESDPAKKIKLREDRYLDWVRKGARPSEGLARLLEHTGVLSGATLPEGERRPGKESSKAQA